jgi:uncharacterized protein (TIGR01244 family)
MKRTAALFFIIVSSTFLSAASAPQNRDKLDKIQQNLKDDVPHLLCVDDRIATGGQPKDSAYSKLKAEGFRAVLNLRTESEGVDLKHEQDEIEKAGLRYINIPFVSSAPKDDKVDEFINAVKDNNNQPILIHCGSANRVGALWMIYRVVDQGWTEEKALDEAIRIGLTSQVLKTFAHEYIAAHSPKK